MITDFYLPPHPSLAPFVDTYILSTSQGFEEAFANQWPASHETSLVFYLADQPCHAAASTEADLSGKPQCLIGPQTKSPGAVQFRGNYHTFIISFKANGFAKLFRQPAQELTGKIIPLTAILGTKAEQVFDRFLHASSVEQMALHADEFLLSFCNQVNHNVLKKDGIAAVTGALGASHPSLPVAYYAQKANMSVRTFERRFTEQVGVAPKMYLKLFRLNQALHLRLLSPAKSWTAIAHECGYFDQMHFIKDFKQFTGLTPTQFTFNQLQAGAFPLDATQGKVAS
jgi:AraC-like DNA-binding protein